MNRKFIEKEMELAVKLWKYAWRNENLKYIERFRMSKMF